MKQKFSGFARKAGRALWLSDHLTGLFVCLIAVFCAVTVTASASGGGSTEVNSNIGGQDITISAFSELICETFSNNISQSAGTPKATYTFMHEADNAGYGKNHFALSNIGNVLGYPGQKTDSANSSNIWTDGDDASSKMLTLDTLWSLHKHSADQGDSEIQDSVKTSAIAQYIVFGSALNALGVDEFRDAKSASDGVRSVIGYAGYILFVLAYTATDIMKKVIDIMKQLNIFMVIWEKGGEAFLKLIGAASINDVPLLREINSALTVMRWLRWVILGVMVILFVASITVWKSRSYSAAAMAQTKGRKLVYRLIIMCIGIPLCGMFYTECLEIIEPAVNSSKEIVTSYVFQEFMDFGAWTTEVTDSAGVLRAFRTGSGDSWSGDNPFAKFRVKYESDGHKFTFSTVEGTGTNTTVGVLDVGQFVYAVNEACYGSDVTGKASEATYVRSLFRDGAESSSYYDSITQDGSALYGGDGPDEDSMEAAYDKCRNLLLNYARSTTVKPDVLNSYYMSDMKELSDLLVEGGSTADSSTNQAAALNATVIEKLFGSKAAEQRIWSFIDIENDWIYPATEPAKNITLLDTSFNGGPAKVTVQLSGLAAVSDNGGSGTGSPEEDPTLPGYVPPSGPTKNNVVLTGPGGSTAIMTRTLSNSGTAGSKSVGYQLTLSSDASVPNSVEAINAAGTDEGRVNNYVYEYTYSMNDGGMSPLAVYNYMHSKFENGKLTVYSPKLTTNTGVGMMHYSVTTPYSGIPELVQLLYILAVLFSLGIIGWVFGVSLLMNTIVQLCKALPIMIKMLMGSVEGFVEGLLIVFSVMIELLVTVALYTLSNHIIDFLIRLVRSCARLVIGIFNGTGAADQVLGEGEAAAAVASIDPETYAIFAGLLSAAIILWGTFQLIKWRLAITISIKSNVTRIINSIFGTSAAMPTGASSGMMKAAAGLAAGGMIAGALAEQGALDDVVNDLTQSDLGTSLHDKISEGDWEGAMEDIRDYANGDYEGLADGESGDVDRGENDTDWAQAKLGDGADSLDGTFGMQTLTDAQEAELDDKYGDAAKSAAEKFDEARKKGDTEGMDAASKELRDVLDERASDAARMRQENRAKAEALGVADYGEYLRSQGLEEGDVPGLAPVEGADLPEEPEKELTADAQMAYDAAREGDAEKLRSAAGIYDENGLTEAQREAVNEAVKDGASEGEIAGMVEDFAEENFGENHAAVVDKMNEAAGRASGALYGDSDNSGGDARTVAVASGHDGDGKRTYGVKDNSSNEGAKTFTTASDGTLEQQFADDLPEDPGRVLSEENQDTYDAALDGDQEALAAAAERLDENGLTEAQAAEIDAMVADGASAEDIAGKVDQYAKQNLGDNHKAVMERVNAAAGRGNTATYGSELDPDGREVKVRAKEGSLDGTDWGVTDKAEAGAKDGIEATFQGDGKGGAAEISKEIPTVPSKALSARNQAIYEAARDGDENTLRQMAGHINGQGLDHNQEQQIRDMIAGGASETEVAAAIDNFAQDNFGDGYKQVIDSMNEAAGRDGTVTYSTPTGGGEDGSEPRSMQVSAGYADGKAAYAVNDLTDPGSPEALVQVSDQDGQSVYTDTLGGKGAEQVVTSDFGTVDGQTYAGIRNEVDAVANASGGMIRRGSGKGGFGQTTVSEAATAIASKQSQAGGGKASTNIGSDSLFNNDISRFNDATKAAAEQAGLDRDQVAGISGGVDKRTGEARVEPGMNVPAGMNLPTAGENGQASLIPAAQGTGTGADGLPVSGGQAAQMPSAYDPAIPGGQPVYGGQAAQMPSTYDPSIPGGQPAGTQDAAAAVQYGGGQGADGAAWAAMGGGQANPDGTVSNPYVPGVSGAAGEGVAYGAGAAPSVMDTSAVPTVLPNGGVDVSSIPMAQGAMPVAESGDAGAAAEAIAAGTVEASNPDTGINVPEPVTAETVSGGNGGPAGSQEAGRSGRKISVPTALGMAAAATTFVKTGSLSGAASSYLGTSHMADAVMTDLGVGKDQPQAQEVPAGSVPSGTVTTDAQGGGSVPAGGNVPSGTVTMDAQGGNVQTGGNVQYGGGSVPAGGSVPSGTVTMDAQGGGSVPAGGNVQYGGGSVPAGGNVPSGTVTMEAQGGGSVPAGGSVQYGGGTGTVYTVQDAQGNIVPAPAVGEKAVATAAVESVGGGTVQVTRANDGTIRNVDAGGNVGTQVMARTMDGQYVPVTTDQSGKSYATGAGAVNGAQAVQLTDGSHVVVTRDAAGNTVMAGSDGAAGTILTRTADGYQPAVTAQNGATYSVNEAGQATGSVVVKTRDGSGVSVVRNAEGEVCMADKNGQPSNIVMAATSDGTYVPVTASGNRVSSDASSGNLGGASVVRMSDGSRSVVTQDATGATYMAGADGTASGSPLAMTRDGYQQTATDASGTVYTVRPDGQPTGAVVVKTIGGENMSVTYNNAGGLCLAGANGQPSTQVVAMTAGDTFAPVTDNHVVLTNHSGQQSTVQVLRLDNGASVAAVPAPSGGGWRLANPDGTPSRTVITEKSDGSWSMGGSGGSVPGGAGAPQDVHVNVQVDTAPSGGYPSGGGGVPQFDPSQLFTTASFKFGSAPAQAPFAPVQQYPAQQIGMTPDAMYSELLKGYKPAGDGSGQTPAPAYTAGADAVSAENTAGQPQDDSAYGTGHYDGSETR